MFFGKYKELSSQLDRLVKDNFKLERRIQELEETIETHYKFKIIYIPVAYGHYGIENRARYFFDKETAIEFYRNNLCEKNEAILFDLENNKPVIIDFWSENEDS